MIGHQLYKTEVFLNTAAQDFRSGRFLKQRKWAHKMRSLQEQPTRNIPRLNV